jgi:hypothetical protein
VFGHPGVGALDFLRKIKIPPVSERCATACQDGNERKSNQEAGENGFVHDHAIIAVGRVSLSKKLPIPSKFVRITGHVS